MGMQSHHAMAQGEEAAENNKADLEIKIFNETSIYL